MPFSYIGQLSGAVAYGKLAHAVIYFKIEAQILMLFMLDRRHCFRS